MASNFKRADVSALSTRTQLYGPVPIGTTSIVFSGTFANVDSTNKSDHNVTLEILNTSNNYIPVFKEIPIPYGGSSKCPKIVLFPGEYIYVTSDNDNMIQAQIDVLERT
jgi:hypothetical protein